MSASKFTPKIIEQMADEYRSGAYSFETLGAKYKITRSRARDLVRSVEPDYQRPDTTLSDEDQQEIIAKYAAGDSYHKLAQAYKVSSDSIRKLAIKHGVSRHRADLSREIKQALIDDFRTKTFSLTSIGQKYGVSADVVTRIFLNEAPDLLPLIRRQGGTRKSFDHYKAYREFCTGRFTTAALGHKYNVGPSAMQSALRRIDPDIINKVREARAKGALPVKPVKAPQ